MANIKQQKKRDMPVRAGVAVYIGQNDGFGHQGLQHGDAVPHHQR